MWHETGPGLCRPCQDADPSPHWERESKAPPLQLYHCCGCQVLWGSTAGCQLMWGFDIDEGAGEVDRVRKDRGRGRGRGEGGAHSAGAYCGR